MIVSRPVDGVHERVPMCSPKAKQPRDCVNRMPCNLLSGGTMNEPSRSIWRDDSLLQDVDTSLECSQEGSAYQSMASKEARAM